MLTACIQVTTVGLSHHQYLHGWIKKILGHTKSYSSNKKWIIRRSQGHKTDKYFGVHI
jgi:hypothetical protein